MGALRMWVDEVSGRINTDERGLYLGEFDTGDLIVTFYADGTYLLHLPDPILKIEMNQLLHVAKLDEKTIVTAVHYDGEKDWTMVKRFQIETTSLDEKVYFIREHSKSRLLFATTEKSVEIEYYQMIKNKKELWTLELDDFIDVKGWKAMGNRLSTKQIRGIRVISAGAEADPSSAETKSDAIDTDGLKAGDTIELDL